MLWFRQSKTKTQAKIREKERDIEHVREHLLLETLGKTSIS